MRPSTAPVRLAVVLFGLPVLLSGCTELRPDCDPEAAPYCSPAAVPAAPPGPGTDDAQATDAPNDAWVSARGRCGDGECQSSEDASSCPEDCSTAPVALHDPLRDDLLRYPDDAFTRDDPSSPTGLRLHFDLENHPGRNHWVRNVSGLYEVLEELDGFGTQAGGFFRFSKPLDPAGIQADDGPTEEFAGQAIVAGWLDDNDTWVELPVEAVLLRPTRTYLKIRPMLPIPPGRQAVFALRHGLVGEDGAPVERSPWLAALLEDRAPSPANRLQHRYLAALGAMIDAGVVSDGGDLVAMTVFTTQTIFEQTLDAAERIRARDHEVFERQGCTDGPRYRTCRFLMEALTWHDDQGYLQFEETTAGEPTGTYLLPVAVYLPLADAVDAEGNPFPRPYRTAIYSHGLSGSRDEARRLAEHTTPYGLAVAAIDAPVHGDHPSAPQGLSEEQQVLQFLGIASRPGSLFDARGLRDNFRTAALDKLALLDLLSRGVDLTGDGEEELSRDNFAFIGMSLGSIMGPEFLALARNIRVAVIAIGGARITDIIQYSDFSGALALYSGATFREDRNRAIYPLLQTAIERGDPGNWAPHVILNRFDDEPAIQVLKGMSYDDEVVPDETNVLMARALDLVHLPPVLRPVGLVEVAEAPTLSGNLPGGGTSGYIQFDLLLRPDGDWQPTRHPRLPDNPVGLAAWNHFLQTYFETGVGEIIDPYALLGRQR